MSQYDPEKPQVRQGCKVRLGFYQPDIPQNLGAAVRLAACFGVGLEIIEPCGFPLTDRALRRSALDYGAASEIVRRDSWDQFRDSARADGRRIILFTTKADVTLDAFRFDASDTLLFGRESAGVPAEVAAEADARVVIPMAAGRRSLNVVNSASIALWEACRQTGYGPLGRPDAT